MREDRMTPEERRALGRRKNPMLHQLEEQLRGSLGLSAEAFHRVRFDRWEAIYEQIADRFADRTRSRRNGLHWANTNGYSPWAMARLAGTLTARAGSSACRSFCRGRVRFTWCWSWGRTGSGFSRGRWGRWYPC